MTRRADLYNSSEIINDVTCFGWTLVSKLPIVSGNSNSSYTSGFELTFQRDTSMQNYSTLERLYCEYNNQRTRLVEVKNRGKFKFFLVATIIALIVGLPFSWQWALMIDPWEEMLGFWIFTFEICWCMVGWIFGGIIAYTRDKSTLTAITPEVNANVEALKREAIRYLPKQ